VASTQATSAAYFHHEISAFTHAVFEKREEEKKAGAPKAHVCPPGTPEHD
jgi:hypothetical protein